MKSFSVICFLAIFAFGAAKITDWFSRFKGTNISKNATEELGHEKIVAGKTALPHAFPYQVGLLFETEKKRVWCGGSLFLKNYVLTAAHCVYKKETAIVFLGVYNILNALNDAELKMKVPKSNFIIHREWKINNSKNDIALIRLPKPIKLNKNIQLVNLPPLSLSGSKLEGKHVTASGWGRFTGHIKYHSHVLRYIHLKVTSEIRCKQRFPSYAPSTNICIKGFHHGKPICVGDSGGPLVHKESDGSKTLVGLASYGSSKGCASGGPIAFTRITPYLDWISSQTGVPVK